jgi:hypothetical protein
LPCSWASIPTNYSSRDQQPAPSRPTERLGLVAGSGGSTAAAQVALGGERRPRCAHTRGQRGAPTSRGTVSSCDRSGPRMEP